MADISNINLPNGENYDIKDKVARNDIAINRTTLGTQCKNLLKHTAVTTSINGVTFTVNADKSITVNGTATSMVQMSLGDIAENGSYILTGCPSGGSTSTYMLSLTFFRTDGTKTYSDETGNGRSIVFDSEKHIRIKFLIQINSGVTVSNLTFYPMLRYADILDDTYEPYQPSVQEQIIGAYFPMTIQKGIGDNTDLNTITEVGNYICWSGSSASTMINCPTKAGGFRLIVTNRFQDCNESDNLRYQWIIPNNQDSVLYYRRSFNTSANSFGSWYSFGGTVVS